MTTKRECITKSTSPRSQKRISNSSEEMINLEKTGSFSEVRLKAAKSLEKVIRERCEGSQYDYPVISREIETALFDLMGDTGQKYFTKLRSLVFNLRDKSNTVLFERVINGDISPSELVGMTTAQMASKELTEWRSRNIDNNLSRIKQMSDVSTRNVKITHKGEVPLGDEDMNVFNVSNEEVISRAVTPPLIDEPEYEVKGVTDGFNGLHSFQRELRELERVREETELMLNVSELCALPEEHLWDGYISMEDSFHFQTVMTPVSGTETTMAPKEMMPANLEVCGRIQSQHAFDYIRTCLNSRRKELVVFRLKALHREDDHKVEEFAKYLATKDRLAVIGKLSLPLTDLYISPYPLESADHLISGVYGRSVDGGPLIVFGLVRSTVMPYVPKPKYQRYVFDGVSNSPKFSP